MGSLLLACGSNSGKHQECDQSTQTWCPELCFSPVRTQITHFQALGSIRPPSV